MAIPRLKAALDDVLYQRSPKFDENGNKDYYREIAVQLVSKAVNGDTEAIKLIIEIEED